MAVRGADDVRYPWDEEAAALDLERVGYTVRAVTWIENAVPGSFVGPRCEFTEWTPR